MRRKFNLRTKENCALKAYLSTPIILKHEHSGHEKSNTGTVPAEILGITD